MWPDGLRYWSSGSSFALAVYFSFDQWIIGLSALFLLTFSVPVILFCFLPPLVLEGAFVGVAPRSLGWLRGVTKWCPGPVADGGCVNSDSFVASQQVVQCLKRCLPELGERTDAVIWYGRGSAQGAVLTAALRDFFSSDGGADVWLDRGFLRWLAYWCFPVWSGYVFLLALTLLRLLSFIDLDPNRLVAAVSLWTLFSIFFLHRQLTGFHRWLGFDRSMPLDRYGLPLDLNNRIRGYRRPPPAFSWQGLVAVLVGMLTIVLNMGMLNGPSG